MIIWLASYPRSGNTFLRMLLFYTCGFKTYSQYNDPLFDRLDASETIGHEHLPASLEELSRAPEPYFVKTHDLPTDSNPAVYLVRDGRDAVVSHARYTLSFGRQPSALSRLTDMVRRDKFERVLRERITAKARYGNWNENVLSWLNRPQGEQLVIRFENLIQDPDQWVKRIVERFGLQPSADHNGQMPDFATLHERWPQFFRKGRTGSWREEMPADLHELFWEHNGEAMRALGYTKDGDINTQQPESVAARQLAA